MLTAGESEAKTVHPLEGCERTGRLGGGIAADIRRRLNAETYKSDFVDGLNLRSLAAGCFMFFACLSPAISFGATMQEFTHGQMGVVEYMLTQIAAGIIFALISGQPLIILRPTGPIMTFSQVIYTTAQMLGMDFLMLHAWTGLTVGTIMIIVALTDTCALVKHVGAFTQV